MKYLTIPITISSVVSALLHKNINYYYNRNQNSIALNHLQTIPHIH